MSESKVSLDPGGSSAPGLPNGGNGSSDPSEKQKHRVKKLLETYTMTAERSLMGPDQSEASEAYANSKYYFGSNYKLPPDVELSKTSPESAKELVKNNIDLAASKRLQMQMAASVAAASGGLKGGALSPPPHPGGMKTPSNGVTLSR